MKLVHTTWDKRTIHGYSRKNRFIFALADLLAQYAEVYIDECVAAGYWTAKKSGRAIDLADYSIRRITTAGVHELIHMCAPDFENELVVEINALRAAWPQGDNK